MSGPYKPPSWVSLTQLPGLSYTYEPLKLDPLDLKLDLKLDLVDMTLDPIMDMELDLKPLTFSARPWPSARAASRNARQSTV